VVLSLRSNLKLYAEDNPRVGRPNYELLPSNGRLHGTSLTVILWLSGNTPHSISIWYWNSCSFWLHYSSFQELGHDTQTCRQEGDLISLTLLFQNNERILKIQKLLGRTYHLFFLWYHMDCRKNENIRGEYTETQRAGWSHKLPNKNLWGDTQIKRQ
jgi:hypothetical protein